MCGTRIVRMVDRLTPIRTLLEGEPYQIHPLPHPATEVVSRLGRTGPPSSRNRPGGNGLVGTWKVCLTSLDMFLAWFAVR